MTHSPQPAYKPPLETITASNLGLCRGERWLYSGVSLSLDAGDILILRGANGCGKSSFLRAFAGLLPFDEGALYYNQTPLRLTAKTSPLHCFWQGQGDGFVGEMTAYAALQARLALSPIAHNISDILNDDLFSIKTFLNQPVRHLSTGQRQRLGLSPLKLHLNPSIIWLLDEPSNALDGAGRATLDDLLSRHQQIGGRTIIASHLDIARNLSHSVLEIGR